MVRKTKILDKPGRQRHYPQIAVSFPHHQFWGLHSSESNFELRSGLSTWIPIPSYLCKWICQKAHSWHERERCHIKNNCSISEIHYLIQFLWVSKLTQMPPTFCSTGMNLMVQANIFQKREAENKFWNHQVQYQYKSLIPFAKNSIFHGKDAPPTYILVP